MKLSQHIDGRTRGNREATFEVDVRETTVRGRHTIQFGISPADGEPNFVINSAAERDALVALLKSVPMV